MAIGLGRCMPTPSNVPHFSFSAISPPSLSTATKAANKTMLRSTSETKPTQKGTKSSSNNTTPSPLAKKQHKRTSSTPITEVFGKTNGYANVAYQPRSYVSSSRPNSLIFSSNAPPLSSVMTSISQSDSHLVDSHFSHRNQYTTINSVPEGHTQMNFNNTERFYLAQSSETSPHLGQLNMSASQPQLHYSSILDIDSEEQRKHKVETLTPETGRKKVGHNSCKDLEKSVS